MPLDAIRATLADHPLLAAVSPATLDRLAAHARSVSTPEGATVFHQGDPAP